ncbi:MAG: S8 family serine peptidase [Coleofasciculus chthonoplastes F3-SA18-01]|uniref:S8 family serine peptidase n=1 Tax=Coleofasciculus chthonoplastes TaxID=64178 RepID=UPI0032F368F3
MPSSHNQGICKSRDQKADYSNYGSEISVCAPSSGAGGWRITTSDVRGTYIDQSGNKRGAGYSQGQGYTNAFDRSGFGGTSSACPLVAGICALLFSIKPDLTSQQVKDLIQKTARRIGDGASYDPQSHSPYYGYGCIDAASAAQAILSEITKQVDENSDDDSDVLEMAQETALAGAQ